MPGAGFWKSKPGFGVQLDRGHPLANGLVLCTLFNSGGALVTDLTGNPAHSVKASATGATWIGGKDGQIATDISGTGVWTATAPPDSPFLGDITIAWRGVVDTGSALRQFVDKYAADAATANPFGFYTHTDAVPRPRWTRANTAHRSWITPATGFNAGVLNKVQTFAVSQVPVIETAPLFYINGQFSGPAAAVDGTGTGAPTGSSKDIRIGQSPSIQMDGKVEFVMIWKRILTPSEHASIAADPYQIFQAPVWRRLFVPGAGGSATMAAQVVTASAIAPNGALNAGSVLVAQAATASVVSPEVALQVNVAMAAQAAAATVAAPNAEIQASSILVAQPSTATVLSPNSAITGGALLAAQASTATAISHEVAFLAGGNVVLSAQAALATVAAPNAAIQAGSVLGASLATATAESPAAGFQVKGELLAQLGTADVVVHSGIFSSGVSIITQPALMTAISPSIDFLAGVQILAQIVTVTAISPEAILVGLGAAEPMHVTGILDVDATVSGNLDADSRIGGTLDIDSTLGGTLGS